MHAVYRKIVAIGNSIRNKFRILHLQLMYGGITIKGSTIGAGCTIVCTKGSTLTLTNCQIDDGVKIIAAHGGHVSITGSYIGSNSVIVAREGITIGANCQIAEMVVIRDQNHNYGEAGKTLAEQGFSTSAITIGQNVWLAAKSTVLMGASIGDNAVLAAHSVAKGELAANTLYVGSIAKPVKTV